MSSLLPGGGAGSCPVSWLLPRYSSWMEADWTRQGGTVPPSWLAAHRAGDGRGTALGKRRATQRWPLPAHAHAAYRSALLQGRTSVVGPAGARLHARWRVRHGASRQLHMDQARLPEPVRRKGIDPSSQEQWGGAGRTGGPTEGRRAATTAHLQRPAQQGGQPSDRSSGCRSAGCAPAAGFAGQAAARSLRRSAVWAVGVRMGVD